MNRNSILTIVAVILIAAASPMRSQRGIAGHPAPPVNLPVLNTMQTVTLGPSYSCNSNFAAGYGTTALFLSPQSKERNEPDLLFNGACGSQDYFEGNTAGDDMSLVADLGTVSLASVTTHATFNLTNVAASSAYTRFALVAPVVEGHTYAVLINKRDVRGLFVFTVTRFTPDTAVDLQYEVKSYQENIGAIAVASGFDWNK